MPTPSDEYQRIHARLDKLRQRRAVLEAEETRRREAREALAQELKEAGVNLEDLGGERKRLQDKVESLRREAARLVDEFEKKLEEAERGETRGPTQELGDTTQEAGQSPSGADVEID